MVCKKTPIILLLIIYTKPKTNTCPSGKYLSGYGSSRTSNIEMQTKTNTCPSGKYLSGYGSSRTSNDPDCKPKINTCPSGKYLSGYGSSRTSNDQTAKLKQIHVLQKNIYLDMDLLELLMTRTANLKINVLTDSNLLVKVI